MTEQLPHTNVNWRDLFIKYVNIVGEAEGVTFIFREDWTCAEWKAILSIEAQDSRGGHSPKVPCTCQNGIGCVLTPLEQW